MHSSFAASDEAGAEFVAGAVDELGVVADGDVTAGVVAVDVRVEHQRWPNPRLGPAAMRSHD